MYMSESMRELLAECAIENLEKAAHTPGRARRYNIWTKTAPDGRPYWGVRNFYGVESSDIAAGRHLGWLEWDNNELFISVDSACKVPLLLKRAAGIMKYWKKQLERDYPETHLSLRISFYFIFAFSTLKGTSVSPTSSVQ